MTSKARPQWLIYLKAKEYFKLFPRRSLFTIYIYIYVYNADSSIDLFDVGILIQLDVRDSLTRQNNNVDFTKGFVVFLFEWYL